MRTDFMASTYSSFFMGTLMSPHVCVCVCDAILCVIQKCELHLHCLQMCHACVHLWKCSVTLVVQVLITGVPLLISLGKIDPAIPLRIFGSLALLGSCAGWVLPETTGVNLPETVAEAHDFASSVTWRQRLMPCVFLRHLHCFKAQAVGENSPYDDTDDTEQADSERL